MNGEVECVFFSRSNQIRGLPNSDVETDVTLRPIGSANSSK